MTQSLSSFAVLKKAPKKRILEIDILRTFAILFVVIGQALYIAARVPSISGSPTSETFRLLTSLFLFSGLSIFFFVSGFSLRISAKTISNRAGVLSFYKKRALRIFPLYWFFIVGVIIFARPSFVQNLIYIAGLQAFFYPTLIIYHFISVILIFYLLFPLLVFFDDYGRMLTVALIPLLAFAALLQLGFTDPMLLEYYALFVSGIIAAKSGIYDKIQRMESNSFFVLTVLFSVGLLFLVAWGAQHYGETVPGAFLINFCGVPFVLILLYWTTIYVRIFNTTLGTFFTFVAFSTFGVFFIFQPSLQLLSNTLYSRFNVAGTTAVVILVAFIPLLVVAGYLLQFLTNKIVSWGIKKRKDKKLSPVQM